MCSNKAHIYTMYSPIQLEHWPAEELVGTVLLRNTLTHPRVRWLWESGQLSFHWLFSPGEKTNTYSTLEQTCSTDDKDIVRDNPPSPGAVQHSPDSAQTCLSTEPVGPSWAQTCWSPRRAPLLRCSLQSFPLLSSSSVSEPPTLTQSLNQTQQQEVSSKYSL